MYEEREEAMAELFADLDDDNDGQIDSIEFRDFILEFRERPISNEEVGEIFARIDTDGDGRVEFDELVQWWENQ